MENSRLKFRARNKVEEFMDTAWSIDWEHELVCHRAHNQSDLKDCVLMQYTGLKDKNGKEIFEGDIVEYGLLTGKIIFESGAFQFEILKSEHSQLIGERDCLIDLSEDGFEIIGNIYENPELLETAK